MDEFSQSLERDHPPEWSDDYLDYQSLQDKVEAAAASDHDEVTAQHRKDQVQSELAVCHPRFGNLTQHLTIRFVLLQPLLTRTSRRSYPSIGSKSQLYNEMCMTLRTHTGVLKIACQTARQTTQAKGSLIKRTCKGCKLLGSRCQTCCRCVWLSDPLDVIVRMMLCYPSMCPEWCCLQYVSINVRGIRKVLNKFDRISSPQKPKDGCMTLQVERPHHAGSTTFQVGVQGTPLVACVTAILWHGFT